MKAELLPVMQSTWPEIWMRLARHPEASNDLFVGLADGMAPIPQAPIAPPPPLPAAFDQDGNLVDPVAIASRNEFEKALATYAMERDRYETALSSEALAKSFFKDMMRRVTSEIQAVAFLEKAYEAIGLFDKPALNNKYAELVKEFLKKFSLRYEVRDPFRLHATLPGVFARLMLEVKTISSGDPHLADLMTEFEEAFSDLRIERTQARIKTCLQKQFNLLEGLGGRCPGVTEATLGGMCNQLDWPHATVKELGKKLYGFGSSYPGVRHAGNPQGVLRNLDMRDFVSISLILASFTPYVTHGLDFDRCYSA